MVQTESSPGPLDRSGASETFRLLVVSSPDAVRVGQSVTLKRGVVFGRTAAEAVDDPRMSGEHFRMGRAPSGLWWCEDADSKNGTYVGGHLARRRVLAHDDVVRAGDTVFLFDRQPPPDASGGPDPEVVADSAASVALFAEAGRAAASDLYVLLQGETGTGKEVVAQAVHRASGRRGRLVAVNCGAIPAELVSSQLFGHRRGAFTGAHTDHLGLVGAADGGTLFLDELGELPPAAQVALLRVLEAREILPVGGVDPTPVDLRVIAATNADLRRAVASGAFREDLWARISEWPIQVPPLRHRKADIPALVDRFGGPGTFRRFTADAVEALVTYRWPRNVRELRTLVRRTVADRPIGEVGLEALPEELSAPIRERSVAAVAYVGKARPERAELAEVLARSGGSVAEVARHFGKDRRQIYRWLKDLGLDGAPS